jgi:hypothetical protein
LSHEDPLSLAFLAERLREYAHLFQIGIFPTVASILNKTAQLVESSAITQTILDDAYAQLQNALQKEFSQGISWRKDIFDDVDAILRKGSPKFNEAFAILRRTQTAQETFQRILSVATQQKEDLTQMYLLCFLYLILFEGVYDEVIRFLYALHLKLPNSNSKIKDIKDRFNRDRVGQSLFDGWNPTVRNGIAHATFSLDPRTEQAYFEDRQSNKSELLSFDSFRDMAQKIFDVGTATQVLLITKVLVPMNFHEVMRNIQGQLSVSGEDPSSLSSYNSK